MWIYASFLYHSKAAFLDGVCRDHAGTWVEGIYMATHTLHALEAELSAVLMSLQWA
ncbi:hypothetical protein BVRB_5g125180 [Beta vulgaris subsp. vulgaris]|uniref:RNase H type-1 domain-containing protein n=1 Tax=Beta vulgaris subsp. vulgaris TaxID=3555 RepID=A0A0J8E3F2_BETVV|nr:hypothetical protein BVRB_5g125180 [Beta vulgaris subsp. vulgaris]